MVQRACVTLGIVPRSKVYNQNVFKSVLGRTVDDSFYRDQRRQNSRLKVPVLIIQHLNHAVLLEDSAGSCTP